MRPIRLLIVTHAPLSTEFGAGQTAIHLAEAFRSQGHDVTLWSPHPLPIQTKWWQSLQQMHSKLDAFIETQKPFDVIDCHAILITQRVSQSASIVVARSVQPDMLYLAYSLNDQRVRSLRDLAVLPFSYLYILFQLFLIIQGWRRATYILCLGSLELQWMKKWFPWWRNKLAFYVNALSTADQIALAKIRQHRQKHSEDSVRFLWIGRWAFHKGTDILIKFIVKRAALSPQDTFTIAGCGTRAEKDLPPELLESGRLKTIPSFERSQLYSLLAAHDVGLFTSRVEGWGLVLNEMLESGLPVFATPVGGVPELQPFFKGMLRQFPPPLPFIPDFLTNSLALEDYYRTFNWEKTSETYALSILTHLKKRGRDLRQGGTERI